MIQQLCSVTYRRSEGMEGRYILISGSAGYSCPKEKLHMSIRFVEEFTQEVLRRGGGLVVLAGAEKSTQDEQGVPHIFDWLVLRQVEHYAVNTLERPRVYARVVMSDAATESKIDDANLRILRNLEQRNVIERHHIEREAFTGGAYRRAMLERADALLAVGGGKGTYSIGREMLEDGKPVLPLDLRLGSVSNDGDGAVTLHREMMSYPAHFLPHTSAAVANRIGLISLDRGNNEVEAVSLAVAQILEDELEASKAESLPARLKKRVSALWGFVKALPFIAAAIKIADFLRNMW